jgi:hypothetical protein
LHAACPASDDLSRFPAGFRPHLSVGQARSATAARQLVEAWLPAWLPLHFDLSAVALIRRGQDSPFTIDRWIPLVGGN